VLYCFVVFPSLFLFHDEVDAREHCFTVLEVLGDVTRGELHEKTCIASQAPYSEPV